MYFKFAIGSFIWILAHTYEQNDFRMVLDHWELNNYSNVTLDYFYLKNVKPNRTCKGVSIKMKTKIDFTVNKFQAHIEAFQFYHNEYRRTPIVFVVKVCEVLEKNLFGIETITTTNGNITKCPIRKNTYYIHNFNFDVTKWPPHVPRGRYQIKLSFKNGDSDIATLSCFGSIEDIVKY